MHYYSLFLCNINLVYCGVLCLLRYVSYVVFGALFIDPLYNFFSSQSLFLIGFLEISLKMVYLTSGIDGKRLQKVEKGGKR